VFENKMLKKIFGLKRDGQEDEENSTMRSFITSTLRQVQSEWSRRMEIGRACRTCGRKEECT
jgi:hypothetical protein